MTIRWAYLKRVLAGAIFGLYMANLLYFLNPQVEVTLARLALVTLVYGCICGVLFGSVLWLLRVLRERLIGRPDESRTHGFGFVVLAAFVSSAIYWMHLLKVRIYLPVGAVRILGKATNAITLTAFALLVLWFFERNADRRASRVIFGAGVLLIALSSVFLYQRRDSYRTEDRSAVVANVGTVAGQRPVIVIAIRNLPHDWIVTMGGEGTLPFLEAARQRDYFARLEPFPTTSPKSLWASLATGELPFRHGVTGRFSYRTLLNGPDRDDRFLLLPGGVGFRAWGLIPPVHRIAAQLPSGDALPLWTLFERLSFHAAVINWPAAMPSSATLVVGERAIRAKPPVTPAVARAAQRLNGSGRARDAILGALAADLAAVDALRAAAGARRYELTVAALDGFAEAQRALRVWGNTLPPKGDVRGEALRAYAEQIDQITGAIARDFPEHLVVVVSPSGVAPPLLATTPWEIARQALTGEDPGADDGFVLIGGPGVVHRENATPVHATDIVPSILFAAGLPVARDMDGRVITDAFSEEFLRRTPLSLIQTYEAKQIVVRRGPGV